MRALVSFFALSVSFRILDADIGRQAPMKKTFAAVVFASLFSVTAHAQTGPLLGVDAEVAVPVGNFSDGAGLGFGGLLRYEFPVITRANVTARAGFVYHLSKDTTTALGTVTTKFWTIPLLAGLKFAATPSIYLAGEVGVFVNHGSSEIGGMSAGSNTQSDLGLTLGVGYRLSALDLRVGLQILDLGHTSDTLVLAANVGYNF
jgi:hypothetical protein